MVNFVIGMVVGGFVGIVAMALCVASGNADRETEKMMTVINHDKVRNCKDCKFYKVTAGVVPQHYCAAALPTEEWSKKCPLEVKHEESV